MTARLQQLAILALVVLGFTCASAAAAVVAQWNFEQGLGTWATLDPSAQLTAAAGTGQAAEGSFALHITYSRPATAQQLGQRGPLIGAFGTELTEPLTDQAQCLEFSIRTKSLTVLAVSLDENDGSNYIRPILVLPGKWHHVKLYLSEFNLSDDSQDENGRLDPEQIQRLGFIDAYGFFLMMSSQMQAQPFRIPKMPGGDNAIWLDAVKFTDEQPPAATVIEDAGGTAPRFVAVLGPELEITKTDRGPKGKPAWVLKYKLRDRELGLMLWPLKPGILKESAGLHMVLAASNQTALLVQVKERSGAKYNYLLQLDPGADVDQLLAWPDFTLDEETTDPNGKLDVDEITELTVVDGTTLLTGAQGHENQLSIALIEPGK